MNYKDYIARTQQDRIMLETLIVLHDISDKLGKLLPKQEVPVVFIEQETILEEKPKRTRKKGDD